MNKIPAYQGVKEQSQRKTAIRIRQCHRLTMLDLPVPVRLITLAFIDKAASIRYALTVQLLSIKRRGQLRASGFSTVQGIDLWGIAALRQSPSVGVHWFRRGSSGTW